MSLLPAHNTIVPTLDIITNCSKLCILNIRDDKDTICDSQLYLQWFANFGLD